MIYRLQSQSRLWPDARDADAEAGPSPTGRQHTAVGDAGAGVHRGGASAGDRTTLWATPDVRHVPLCAVTDQ